MRQIHQMTSNMPTSDTNKLITATLHPVYHHFAVPNDWDIEDITYESGILFYKGKKQYVPKVVDDGECLNLDKLEEGNWMDFDVYFDCENFDLYKYEEEEEECVSHPPYHCDGGCGKKMGEGNEDDCKRICGDCEEEEEEIYDCCDCGVELDRVRDGEEKPDFRCNNCYWEDKEGIDSKNMITPDYRKQEESEEEEEEEEKEYTIEISVAGWGYCRYYDKEDRDKYVVYCKNAGWKKKGDKTARDLEGNYCETESEDEEEDLCEECEDINCCSKDELICCMCCELLKCDMFSQNCGKCLNPMCMNCDNDERKINGENVCEKCERKKENKKRKKERKLMSKEDK